MAYDGSLKFDTRVDSSGFKSGIEKLGSIAKTGLKVTATAIGAVSGAFGAAVLSGVILKFTETEFYSWAVIPEMNMALFCEATAQTKQMLFGLLLTPAQQAIYI